MTTLPQILIKAGILMQSKKELLFRIQILNIKGSNGRSKSLNIIYILKSCEMLNFIIFRDFFIIFSDFLKDGSMSCVNIIILESFFKNLRT